MTSLPTSILHVRSSNGARFESQGCRPTPEVDAAIRR
jgi:hypothetical protein